MLDTPSQEYEVLREQISLRHGTLSTRLRQIAKFALDHPTDMALETIATIAQRADVQPSALIRFAKSFGYSGFSEMQRTFQSRVVERSANYKERVRTAGTNEQKLQQSLLTQYCNANIVSLEELRDSNINEDLETSINLLEAADNIYVMAQRRSFSVATYLTYALNHAGCRAYLLDGVGGMLTEHAQSMREKDVLIAVSSPPYSQETIKVTTMASARQVPVIAITDSSLSPISIGARICLKVHDAEVHSFRSLTASMCVAQTLATSLAFRDKD